MRIITQKEQNNIHGGVGTPPGPIAFGGVILILAGMYYLVGSDTHPSNTSYVNNVSCYVNGFFNLSK